MARIRRPKKITGSEYTFGGGSGAGEASAVSGFVKIAKGHPNNTNTNHDGFLSNGDTVNVALDVSTSIQSKDQYIYFDNAFETDTGQVSIEYVAPTTGLPSGVSWTNDNDGGDTDKGSGRIYGTPSAGTEGKHYFKIKVNYPQGSPSEQTEINYVLNILPTGTTPVWSNTTLPDRIIRNTADEQTLSPAPTTSYAEPSYTLTNVSGFASGVNPVIDPETGRVYVVGVGDVLQAASTHSFTVNVNLGEYGVVSQTFTGNISYGDPYGSRYFGPANTNTNWTSRSNIVALADTDTYFNPTKNSGALRRIWNAAEDTSPYNSSRPYGCQPDNGYVPSQGTYDAQGTYTKNGYMGIYPHNAQVMCSASNHGYVRGKWVVPPGVEEVCMVVVGGGGQGAYQWSYDGGGAGGLAWINGVSVTPGEVLEWCFGLGRYCESSHSSYGGGPSWVKRDSGGPHTDFILYASGGGWTGFQNANPTGQNNSYTGDVTVTGIDHWVIGNGYATNASMDSGGYGINTSEGRALDDGQGNGTTWHYGGGAGYYSSGNREGAGAAGYRGNQGTHGSSAGGYNGGGGYGYNYSSTYGQGGGGGVGLDGQGSRGVHSGSSVPRTYVHAGSGYGGSSGSWTSYNFGSPNFYGGGGGGSGGTRGGWGENQFTGREENSAGHRVRVGGMHGGGGGGSGTSYGGGNGAPGGVRIIWGSGADGTQRCFPYTYCSEDPDMKYNGE